MFGEVGRRVRSVRPVVILAIGALLAILYAFPGYMNYDAASQLAQARTGNYDDWHPPIMAWYWRILEQVAHGPLPLLLIQIPLFLWGLYALLRRRFSPRTAALVACAVLLFPPVLTPMAAVWKDAQMAAWMIGGAALALGASWRARIAGIALLVLAAAVRDNACTALPPLLLVIAASWGFRRKLAICAIGFALWVAITGSAVVANQVVTKGHAHAWSVANAIHDIAGTICYSDPMSDDEVRAALVGIPLRRTTALQARFCAQYNPRWWFPLSFNDLGLFETQPTEADRDARRAAWFRLVSTHTEAFLTHRWQVTKELLGITVDYPEEPVCQTFAGTPDQLKYLKHDATLSFFQRVMGRKFVKLSRTLLYRPWAYLLVGLIVGIYAAMRKDGLVVALIASGFLYEASFLLGAAGPAYRYSHWMVMCVTLATVIIFGEQLREGRRRDRDGDVVNST
jgi:hypothetical protein